MCVCVCVCVCVRVQLDVLVYVRVCMCVCGMIVKVLEWKRVSVKVWWCMIRKNERVVVHEREMKTKYKILETDFFFFFSSLKILPQVKKITARTNGSKQCFLRQKVGWNFWKKVYFKEYVCFDVSLHFCNVKQFGFFNSNL